MSEDLTDGRTEMAHVLARFRHMPSQKILLYHKTSVNPLWPSEQWRQSPYFGEPCHHWFRKWLILVACWVLSTADYQAITWTNDDLLHPQEWTSVEFESKHKNFHSIKSIWKCLPFCLDLNILNEPTALHHIHVNLLSLPCRWHVSNSCCTRYHAER